LGYGVNGHPAKPEVLSVK